MVFSMPASIQCCSTPSVEGGSDQGSASKSELNRCKPIEVLLAEQQSAPPPRWAWMSQQLARSGIDPDVAITGPRRGALIVGIAVIVLTVWQVFAGTKGPISAILAVIGFFAELAVIAIAGFCALFAIAMCVIWVGRRSALW